MRRLVAIAAIVLGAAWLGAGAAAAPPATGATWSFAADWQANAKGAHANPFPDAYGDAGVWHMMGSATTARTPATYTDMAIFGEQGCGDAPTPGWSAGPGAPPEFHGTTGRATIHGLSCAPGQLIEPGKAYGHPGTANDVVVGWQSPIAGTVTITGGLADADAGGGSGIAWFVALNGTDIDSGSFPNGGKSAFKAGLSATVKKGDFIYVIVDPNGEYSYDLTRFDVTITAGKGGGAAAGSGASGGAGSGGAGAAPAGTPVSAGPNTRQSIPDFWVGLSARVITRDTLGLGSDLALTAGATNNQVLSTMVFERATGCLVEGVYVDLLDPSGNPVVPPGQVRHAVPQTREGYLDIGGLRNLAPGTYHLWVYARNSAGNVVMQSYLPVTVKARGGSFVTLNGRTFASADGRSWQEARTTALAGAAAGGPFDAITSAFQSLMSGIANTVSSLVGTKTKAKAAQAVAVLSAKGSAAAKVQTVQSKTAFTPAFLVTTTAPQAPVAQPASVKLLGQDGASLLGQDGASLIGQDGAGLIGHDGSTLVGQDGASIVSHDGGTLITSDGAGVVAAGAGNIIAAGAGNLTAGRRTASATSVKAACLNGYKTVGDGRVLFFGKTPVLAGSDGKVLANTYVITGRNEMPVNGTP